MMNLPQIKAKSLEIFKQYLPDITIGKNILCPLHDDRKTKSFRLYGTADDLKFKCFGCGKQGDGLEFIQKIEGCGFEDAVKKAENIIGLNGNSKQKKTLLTPKQIQGLTLDGGYKFSRVHTYKKGAPEYKKAIYKNNAGDKQGRFFTLINKVKNLYIWGRQSSPVLYNGELLEGKKVEGLIFACESEQDAENLVKLGLVAVSSGGANSWRDEFSNLLQGREIIIPPHNDIAGKKFAETVAKSLQGEAISIKILDAEIFGNFRGADVSDWIAQGGTKDRLIEIINNAPEWSSTDVTDVTVLDKDLILISPFPFDVFPKKLLSIIKSLSNALHVEPELIASTLLTITSGAIGNTIRVSPKQGYEVTPFIWLIIIALSGYGKSPVVQTLLKYIKHLQAKNYKKYQAENKEYEGQLRKSKEDKSIDMPDKPKLRHSIVSDCTVEALANVFENDGRGVVIYQDEIAGLIFGLDQYKGKGNDRQHYLELFNCDSWKIDRKSGVKFIQNTGASIIGGIQPKVMPKVFNGDSFDDGFLPRFLLLNAENGATKFSRQPITEDALLYWTGLLDWCYRLPLSYDDLGFIQPKVLILSSDALTEYERFYNDYGDRMPFLSERAKVFIPKLTAYYSLKFAGVLQAIKAFDNGASIGSLIDAETIKDAIGLTKFFAGQVVRTLQHYEGDSLTEYQKRLVNVLYRLQGEVSGGRLPLSRIVDTFNEGLPEAVRHTPEKISSMLKEFVLTTAKGSHNLSFLQWEAEKIQKIFSKTTVTTVTSVTQKDTPTPQKVTDVTDVTVYPEEPIFINTEVD